MNVWCILCSPKVQLSIMKKICWIFKICFPRSVYRIALICNKSFDLFAL